MMHKPFHIILLLLFFISVPSPAAAIDDQLDAINMNQTTFEESITELSEIFGMKIILVGISDLPQHKFSFTLDKATFEQAIKEAMQKAGIQNHVLAWDQQTKTAWIWILPAGTTYSISNLDNYNNNMKTITPKGFSGLEAVKSENLRMMTKDEFSRLETESTNNYRGMTPEEFENLEAAESENFRMMTKDEFARLEPKSTEKYRAMTPEEFTKLKPEL